MPSQLLIGKKSPSLSWISIIGGLIKVDQSYSSALKSLLRAKGTPIFDDWWHVCDPLPELQGDCWGKSLKSSLLILNKVNIIREIAKKIDFKKWTLN